MNKKKKKTVIIVLMIIFIAVISVFVYKYRDRIARKLESIFTAEGKVKGLEVNDTSGWTELNIADAKADIIQDQSLMLINKEHKIDDSFIANVSEYKNSEVIMNVCIMEAYEKLANEVFERFEQKLYVRSAYRSAEQQLEQIEQNGEKATEIGASEHQAGLALDVYVPYYAGAGFINCDAGKWVNKNCGEYGFIIRYPSYGKETTGIDYEPWHIRYVGYPHSKIIMDSNSTLEGYISYFEPDKVYKYKEYYIYRMENDTIKIPEKYEQIIISPDNLGGYIVTVRQNE